MPLGAAIAETGHLERAAPAIWSKAAIATYSSRTVMAAFVTQYDKTYKVSGDVKIICRYVSLEMGELMVGYLRLVLPVKHAFRGRGVDDAAIQGGRGRWERKAPCWTFDICARDYGAGRHSGPTIDDGFGRRARVDTEFRGAEEGAVRERGGRGKGR